MSNDLIRRSDAIETAYQLRHKPNDEEWDWWLRSFNAIPSADRPQGEWEDYDRYMKCCSKCGWIQDILHFGSKFCPNCGCRMKGADDE